MNRNVKLTYDLQEVSAMFGRLDELSRENRALRNSLQEAREEINDLKAENEDLLERVTDFEVYYARQRTEAKVLPLER